MSNSKTFFFHAKRLYNKLCSRLCIQLKRKKNQAKQRWQLRNGQNIIGTCLNYWQTNAVHHDLKVKVTLQGWLKQLHQSKLRSIKCEGRPEGYWFYWYNLKAVNSKHLNTIMVTEKNTAESCSKTTPSCLDH